MELAVFGKRRKRFLRISKDKRQKKCICLRILKALKLDLFLEILKCYLYRVI